MTAPVWSEWREHVPGLCPVPVGTLVDSFALCPDGRVVRGKWRVRGGNSFRVKSPTEMMINGAYVRQVIRYRIRQYPDAFEKIRQLAEDPGKMAEVCA